MSKRVREMCMHVLCIDIVFDYCKLCYFIIQNKEKCIENCMCQIVSQSPAIMQMLDKSGSCSKFENYQRPEGFPVGMSA